MYQQFYYSTLETPINHEAYFSITHGKPGKPARRVGELYPCFIIAEIGQNHNGNIDIAKKLMQCAKEAGVDCVKFQKSDLNSRFTQEVLNRRYESPNSFGTTYGQHRRSIELTNEEFYQLNLYASALDIHFTASGMDKPSIDFLHKLDVPFFKIGSADCTNIPLLKHASRYGKPLVISTGMTHRNDVTQMYEEIIKVNPNLAILQCTSSYPTSVNEVNLNVIKSYKELLPKAVIGYSGHEVGTEISVAAVAAGARIIERHITLDHSLKGSDHTSSLNPAELKELVSKIKNIEQAMGSFSKRMQDGEQPCIEKLGKTVVARKYLPSGTILEENMLDIKVAVKKGWSPINFYDLIGRTLKKDYVVEETIMPEDVV